MLNTLQMRKNSIGQWVLRKGKLLIGRERLISVTPFAGIIWPMRAIASIGHIRKEDIK